MQHANVFLVNLAIVLCVAAATTVVFQRLRQPVVLGYLLAGLIVGPYTGAIVAISSTTIIAKAFDENGVTGRLRELVLSVLVIEDLVGILMLAGITALSGAAFRRGRFSARRDASCSSSSPSSPWECCSSRASSVRRCGSATRRPPCICFAGALLANRFGYSVALGAFVAGSLVAESGEGERLEHLLQPVRDLFAAVFFVSVGMLIDPALIARHVARGACRGRRRHRGKVHRSLGARDAVGRRCAHVSSGGHEHGPDRRVLVHHRRSRAVARRDARLSLVEPWLRSRTE